MNVHTIPLGKGLRRFPKVLIPALFLATMKQYAELFAASKDERETELKNSIDRSITLADSKTVLQKLVAKLLVAMTNAGEIGSGDMRKQAQKITGHDIRETLQNVYELVNVFAAIEKGEIELTEEDFDKLDTSKLALLSPFLTKPDLKEKLGEAVEKAKIGTAKDIRELKPKSDKGDKKTEDEKPKGTEIPIGFVATDITATDPLVKSAQFKARLRTDFARAIETEDDESLMAMVSLFGKAYASPPAKRPAATRWISSPNSPAMPRNPPPATRSKPRRSKSPLPPDARKIRVV